MKGNHFFCKHGSIVVLSLTLFCWLFTTAESLARRTYVSPEEQHQLSTIHTVLVSTVLVLPEGLETPTVIQKVVRDRLHNVGFAVVLDGTQSHDAVIRVTCKEEKRETATTRYEGDAELPFAPDRLWHGAACLLSYRLMGKDFGWYQEVRAGSDALVEGSRGSNRRERFVQQLAEELERFDFPVFLLSEWGQTERLLALLRSSETGLQRKQRILEEFRYLPAPEGKPLFLNSQTIKI